MPAQMGRTGRPVLAIAQQEQGCATFCRAQAQASAGGEIEHFGHGTNIGDNAGHRPAGQSLFGHPEQVAHIGSPHDHQTGWVEAKGRKTRPIGQTEKLRILRQLQIEHSQALGRQQRPGLAQRKGETGAAIANGIGKHILQQPTRQVGKGAVRRIMGAGFNLCQGRLSFDFGNDIPQRGKALLGAWGLHGGDRYKNKERTFRLRIRSESSPFVPVRCVPAASAPIKTTRACHETH